MELPDVIASPAISELRAMASRSLRTSLAGHRLAGFGLARFRSAMPGLALLCLALVASTAFANVGSVAGTASRAVAQSEWTAKLHLPLALYTAPGMRLPTPRVIDPPTRAPSATATSPAAEPSATGEPATALPSTEPTGEPSRSPEPTPSTGPTPTPGPSAAACDALPAFDDSDQAVVTVHVAVDGSDQSGDGSAERPFASIQRAAREADPGTSIVLHPGRYAGGNYVADLRGIEDVPIHLGGLDPANPPVIAGGGTGLHLVRPAWLVLHDLVVEGASTNGINVDDGGDMADDRAANHLIFRRLVIRDIGSGGNQDCLKLSGLYDVLVADSQFARCGDGGSGIDMVGVHRAIVARNRFEEMGANAVQIKGGSSDVEIRWNRMHEAGARAVNMGGSTGFEFFRPPLDPAAENTEARDVRVLANLIQGGETPWAFVGCVDCLAAHNTVVEPRNWLMRILQETTSRDGFQFAPARGGQVVNNLFVFRRGQLRADVNVGGGTDAGSFRFAHNLFYAPDDPARSAPQLPGMQLGTISGWDPLLRADFGIPADSPAAGAGLAEADPPGARPIGDLAGRCWQDPPSIGAFEVSP